MGVIHRLSTAYPQLAKDPTPFGVESLDSVFGWLQSLYQGVLYRTTLAPPLDAVRGTIRYLHTSTVCQVIAYSVVFSRNN